LFEIKHAMGRCGRFPHQPGKVFDLTLPLDRVAEGYRAMDERRAIKALLQPYVNELNLKSPRHAGLSSFFVFLILTIATISIFTPYL
jgi:hypothetical protein